MLPKYVLRDTQKSPGHHMLVWDIKCLSQELSKPSAGFLCLSLCPSHTQPVLWIAFAFSFSNKTQAKRESFAYRRLPSLKFCPLLGPLVNSISVSFGEMWFPLLFPDAGSTSLYGQRLVWRYLTPTLCHVLPGLIKTWEGLCNTLTADLRQPKHLHESTISQYL